MNIILSFFWCNSFTLYNICCIQYEHHPFHSSYPHHHGSRALIRSGSGGGWKGCTVGPDKGSPVTRCRSNRFYAHSHAGETRPYRATGLAASPASDSWFVTGGSGGSGGLSELEICLSGWNRLEVTSSGTVGFGSGMRAKLTWCVVNHSRCKAQGDCFANDDSRVEVAALFSKTL